MDVHLIDKARLIILYGEKVLGFYVKVYVLGDNREHSVKLSNFINSTGRTAIMSEEVPSDYSDLVEDMLHDGDKEFDLTVVISRQPVETCIEANRNERFRAAMCRNLKEAAMAKAARTNVLVLDGNDFRYDETSDIVGAWLGSHEQRRAEEEEEVREAKPVHHEDVFKHLLSFAERKPEHKKHKKAEREKDEEVEEAGQEEEEEEGPKPKGGGIVKSIKYTFGIE